MGKLAKKVQGAIPVVSLVSKLLTPEGGIGVETLSYNEYCRIKLDAAGGTAYGEALSELCDAGKKEPRTLLLLTWMVYEGDGLLPVDQAMSAARRLASTGFDYEYEIYKFEQARDEALGRMRRGGRQRTRDQAARRKPRLRGVPGRRRRVGRRGEGARPRRGGGDHLAGVSTSGVRLTY